MSSLIDTSVERLRERGFDLPAQVKDPPDLPPDVTVINSRELMRLMTAYTGMLAYASSEEALAAGRAKSFAGRYKQARAQRYLEIKFDGKRSEKHLEHELDADDDLNGYRKEELAAESYARLVRAILSGFEAKYNLLSRELTRRSQDLEREE